MAWVIYESLHSGDRIISDWPLQKAQRIRLEQRLDLLRSVWPMLPRNLVPGPGIDGQNHIYKFKVKGNVQLRPLLCRGTGDGKTELTFLARATERDDVLEPAGIAAEAESRRIEVRNGTRERVLMEAKKKNA